MKQSKGLEDKSNKSEQNRERKNSETNYERRLSTNSLERRLSESNLENKNVDVIKHPKSDQTLEKNDKINQLSRDISQTMQNSESIPSAEDIRQIVTLYYCIEIIIYITVYNVDCWTIIVHINYVKFALSIQTICSFIFITKSVMKCPV